MATVDAAIERGLADAARLSVWGASCMAVSQLAGLLTIRTRFCAAVAESCVTNFSTLYYLCDSPDMFARDLGGRPHEIPDVYRAFAAHICMAVRQTLRFRCCTGEDLRCPVVEAELIALSPCTMGW